MSDYGLSFACQDPFSDAYPTDQVVTDHVSVYTKAGGFSAYGAGIRISNCSFLNGSGYGMSLYRSSSWPLTDAASFTATNCLITCNAQSGVTVNDTPTWLLEHANASGNGTNISPDPAHMRHVTTTDPKLGPYKVWIPEGSPMKRAGKDGADIGANVLYRYERGVLTDQPL